MNDERQILFEISNLPINTSLNLTMQPVCLFYMYRLPVYYIYSNQMIQKVNGILYIL